MTTFQYNIAKIFKGFGILRKQKRLNEAAEEIRLLRIAENIIGKHAWANTEEIEQYKVQYWNLDKLTKQKSEIEDKVVEISDHLSQLKKNKIAKFDGGQALNEDELEELKLKQLRRLKKLSDEKEDIKNIAGNIRNLYESTTHRIQELKQAGAETEVIQKEENNLIKFKTKFAELKKKKQTSEKSINHQKTILDKINDSLALTRSNYREGAAENYSIMGKANKALSTYRSQLGIIESKISENYAEIGNKISKDCFHSSQCRKAVGSKWGLCKLIQALRQSIDYNYSLSGR